MQSPRPGRFDLLLFFCFLFFFLFFCFFVVFSLFFYFPPYIEENSKYGCCRSCLVNSPVVKFNFAR